MPTLFEFLPIGAYRSDASGKMLRANAALVRIDGFDTEEELLATFNDDATEWYVDPDRRSQFRQLMAQDGHVVNFVSETYRHKTGERIWIREAAHLVRDAQGALLYYEGTVEDITAAHRAHLTLQENEERWKLALESTGDGVWDWYIQTGDEFYSPRCKQIYGFSENEIPNRADALDERTHPDDIAQMQHDREAHFNGQTPTYRNEHRILCKNNSWKWVLTRGMVISRDALGRPLRMIGTHTDITDQKEADALIWRQANFDPLTGLPNRRMLRQQLQDDIERSQRLEQSIAIVFIDLDQFKEVNDTLGHNSGDLLLVKAAQRIKANLGPLDRVARMGGDEFTVVICDVRDTAQLEGLLQSILYSLSDSFQLQEEQVFVSASLGVAMYPGDATLVEDLFKHADQALYVAKAAGRNRFSFFTPSLQEAAQTRLRLASDLRMALELRQFEVVYQPIVDMASGRIFKAEALLRWHHPQRGLVSPAQFIGLAESTGLIISIGEWVFQQAAQQVKHWRGLYGDDFQISVNKSPVQFHRTGSASEPWIKDLHALGLPGSSIAIEITEGLLLNSSAAVSQQLLALREAGIAVSLDDFGTGYSSLTYLQRFTIDFVKIDQSFVRNLTKGSTDLALCKAIIVMAHELGMKVVAEGVETIEQRDLLMNAGCDFGQGYLFAKPLRVSDFEAFMQWDAAV
jgi:diguanylate cyclase (GGDEF)-like protein/PAS domain S-box-containing protein